MIDCFFVSFDAKLEIKKLEKDTFSCHSISVSQIEKLNIASRLWNTDIDVTFLFLAVQKWTAFSISKRKENFKSYEKDIEAISHRLSAWILIPTFATATRPKPTQAHA